MSGGNTAKLNEALHGCVELLRFDLSRDAEGKRFDLRLALADAKGRGVLLLCRDVQNLELNPAGNGFEKMCLLEVSDMSGDGLDRIRFCVEEVKRETLFLHCGDLELREDAS